MHSAHTFLGLHFTNTVDPAALVTLVLAIAAIIGLILTRRSLNQTQEEIALSRKEVQEAHRPVVVPIVAAEPPGVTITPIGPSKSRRIFPMRPCVPEAGVLVVPVKNIGSGPALRVEASVKRLNDDGSVWVGGAIEPKTPGTAAGLGKDQTIHIPIHEHGWEERWSFELTLTYTDVAGKGWITTAGYVPNPGRYENVVIAEQSDSA